MIIEFSAKNFRSIKELQTISFRATGLKSTEKNQDVDSNNIFTNMGEQMLKTIGLYGPNASGKSNIIKAFDLFIKTITKEPSSQSDYLLPLCEPFRYQENYIDTESFFQIVFELEGKRFKYGLTIKRNTSTQYENDSTPYSKAIITNEWLFGTVNVNMVPIFIREGQNITNTNFSKDSNIPLNIPYKHSLFLIQAAAFDKNNFTAKIINYLKHWVISNYNNDSEKLRYISISCLKDKYGLGYKMRFIKLLDAFGLSYEDIILEDVKDTDNNIYPQDKILLVKHFNDNNVIFNLRNDESAGTQKLFDLAGMLLRAFSLDIPVFCIIDELDSNFHPQLLVKLISIFNNTEINRNNSQLLFTSHCVSIMEPSLMRRDQFYFCEKDSENATNIYSLSELKGIRNGADFAKQYLAGFYGALPVHKDYMD